MEEWLGGGWYVIIKLTWGQRQLLQVPARIERVLRTPEDDDDLEKVLDLRAREVVVVRDNACDLEGDRTIVTASANVLVE